MSEVWKRSSSGAKARFWNVWATLDIQIITKPTGRATGRRIEGVMTQKKQDWIERKINRAIDAMVDLQDEGYGCDATARILELLNELRNTIAN